MAKVNVYLSFDGRCEDAFNFYKSILGGEFTIRKTILGVHSTACALINSAYNGWWIITWDRRIMTQGYYIIALINNKK
jgi:hypothetical protein